MDVLFSVIRKYVRRQPPNVDLLPGYEARMRKVAITTFIFLALGFAVHAVLSAVEDHNTLSSVNHEQARTSLNSGVFLNAFLALVFVSAAVRLLRSGTGRA